MPYTPPTPAAPTSTQIDQISYLTGISVSDINLALGSITLISENSILKQIIGNLQMQNNILVMLLAGCLQAKAAEEGYIGTDDTEPNT